MSKQEFFPGQIIEIKYPFVWDTRDGFHHENGEPIKERYWRPGHIYTVTNYGESRAICDAFGAARFVVHGFFRPRPYPARVFYTREFCSPAGVWFGKKKLHIAVIWKFRAISRGYKYNCYISGLQVPA